MKVLRSQDLEAILEYEAARLRAKATELNALEIEMQSWHAPWRSEALEHYLPLGWSFGIWSDVNQTDLLGYVLTQPLLFFRGLTQTLWIEHMSASSDEVFANLFDISYRWARDKHFQQILMPDIYSKLATKYPNQKLQEGWVSVSTSKMRSF